MLCIPNAGGNMCFQCFFCLKAEKAQKDKFAAKTCKNGFFKFAPKRSLSVLFPEKTYFSPFNMNSHIQSMVFRSPFE